MAVQVERPCEFMAKGLDFGGLTLCPAEDSNSYILLAIYFQPISLGSQQSMAYGNPLSPRPALSCPGGRGEFPLPPPRGFPPPVRPNPPTVVGVVGRTHFASSRHRDNQLANSPPGQLWSPCFLCCPGLWLWQDT
jgi:hypothetical protein